MKAIFLGDSITEGVGASSEANKYVNKVAEICGVEVKNFGVSGTRIARQSLPSEYILFDYDFQMRAEVMDKDADKVFVFGGTNDFGHGDAPMGTLTDRTEQSFCGAFRLLLEKLILRYPQAQIVVMTPLHRDSENQLGANEIGLRREIPLEGYVDAMNQRIAAHFDFSAQVLRNDYYRFVFGG